MTDTETLMLISTLPFNQRDIDGALASMSEDVSWPTASEGGSVVGKEEIRAYWTRQWQEFDPRVHPVEHFDDDAGRTRVRVHLLVHTLSGELLSDTEVWHIYTLAHGLIERMDTGEDEAHPQDALSLAFSRR